MKSPRLTEWAAADLDDIWLRIALDSPPNANRFIQTILDKCELLAETPRIGRPRPDLAPELRSFAVGHYLILYRSTEEGIDVVRVLHGARNIEALFKG